MGDDIGSGSVTDCPLRSDSDIRWHTQQCRAAPRQKSKQVQPELINYAMEFLPRGIVDRFIDKRGPTTPMLSINTYLTDQVVYINQIQNAKMHIHATRPWYEFQFYVDSVEQFSISSFTWRLSKLFQFQPFFFHDTFNIEKLTCNI